MAVTHFYESNISVVVPCQEDKMSRKFLLPKCRSSVRHALFHACTCDTCDSTSCQGLNDNEKVCTLVRSCRVVTSQAIIPFLRKIIRWIVRLEVDPLPGGQVQPVQVCAVDVTRCPPKHVQKAIYNNHCLQEGRYDIVEALLNQTCKSCIYGCFLRLPVHRFCWASSPDS